MDSIDYLGMVAAIITTMSFLPQAIKTWKTRSTEDISLSMYSLFVIGISLWLIYGICINNWPIICSNAVTVLLAGSILWFKIIAVSKVPKAK